MPDPPLHAVKTLPLGESVKIALSILSETVLIGRKSAGTLYSHRSDFSSAVRSKVTSLHMVYPEAVFLNTGYFLGELLICCCC